MSIKPRLKTNKKTPVITTAYQKPRIHIYISHIIRRSRFHAEFPGPQRKRPTIRKSGCRLTIGCVIGASGGHGDAPSVIRLFKHDKRTCTRRVRFRRRRDETDGRTDEQTDVDGRAGGRRGTGKDVCGSKMARKR